MESFLSLGLNAIDKVPWDMTKTPRFDQSKIIILMPDFFL